MSSIIKVNTVQDQDGNNIINENANTITIGKSGDTVQVASGASLVGAGIEWQSSIVTATTLTAEAGKGYWIDTTSNACTVTFPGSASVGDRIILTDYARNWATNAVTINQNSLKFQGNTSPNPVYDTNGQSVDIVYSGTTKGWIPNSDDDVTLETPQTYTAEYTVLAGGASGGKGEGGGGGAGGLLTNFGGTAINITPGSVYTVTVGAGGAAQTTQDRDGNDGLDSVLSGTGITTITSIGGGAGTYGNKAGNDGGSGGGGSGNQPASAGGSGTAPQGNDGGNGIGGTPGGGGGGGGLGGVGGNATNSPGKGGNGGTNGTNSITGSSVDYAGGGGGGSNGGASSPGGGATAGDGEDGGTGGSASANTGSGGGGSHSGNTGAGGSGVVILRVATSNYSGTTSGSPTVTTDGTDKVIKFTGSGTYTA